MGFRRDLVLKHSIEYVEAHRTDMVIDSLEDPVSKAAAIGNRSADSLAKKEWETRFKDIDPHQVKQLDLQHMTTLIVARNIAKVLSVFPAMGKGDRVKASCSDDKGSKQFRAPPTKQQARLGKAEQWYNVLYCLSAYYS